MQKRRNRSRCRLGYRLAWAQGSVCSMGIQIPLREGSLLGDDVWEFACTMSNNNPVCLLLTQLYVVDVTLNLSLDVKKIVRVMQPFVNSLILVISSSSSSSLCGNYAIGTRAVSVRLLFRAIVGPIPWGHSGPLCHALSLSSSSSSSLWTSMRRRRATRQ